MLLRTHAAGLLRGQMLQGPGWRKAPNLRKRWQQSILCTAIMFVQSWWPFGRIETFR